MASLVTCKHRCTSQTGKLPNMLHLHAVGYVFNMPCVLCEGWIIHKKISFQVAYCNTKKKTRHKDHDTKIYVRLGKKD